MLSPKIKSIQAVEKYKLKIVFQDGISGLYDVSNLARKGVFKIWDSGNTFFEVFVNPESGAISWPGDIESLLLKIKKRADFIIIKSLVTDCRDPKDNFYYRYLLTGKQLI